MRAAVEDIYVSDTLYRYVVALTNAPSSHSAVRLGVSPRGSLALMQMAKASAFAQGRDHLLPDDIVYVAPDVFCHRMLMQGSAADAPALAEAAVRDILAATPLPWTD